MKLWAGALLPVSGKEKINIMESNGGLHIDHDEWENGVDQARAKHPGWTGKLGRYESESVPDFINRRRWVVGGILGTSLLCSLGLLGVYLWALNDADVKAVGGTDTPTPSQTPISAPAVCDINVLCSALQGEVNGLQTQNADLRGTLGAIPACPVLPDTATPEPTQTAWIITVQGTCIPVPTDTQRPTSTGTPRPPTEPPVDTPEPPEKTPTEEQPPTDIPAQQTPTPKP